MQQVGVYRSLLNAFTTLLERINIGEVANQELNDNKYQRFEG
jgi:hypothetical protein